MRAGLLSSAALFVIGCGSCGGERAIHLRYEGVTPPDRPVLVFSGWRSDGCRDDEIISWGGEDRTLLGVVRPQAAECPAEIAAFAQGLGAVAQPWPAEDTDAAWIAGDELRVRFPPPRALRVALWVVATRQEETAALTWVDNQVEYARGLFALHRVGVEIESTLTFVPQTTNLRSALEQVCLGVSLLRDQNLFDPSRLNIYFFIWDEAGTRGRYCVDFNEPDVAFVYSTALHAALAHELGHALGLLEPYYGHTYGYDGFEAPNLMWPSLDYVEDISLGQAYRMNVDADAWWNLRIAPPLSHACQPSFDAGVCPPLALREAQ